jgi:hypothetical protein
MSEETLNFYVELTGTHWGKLPQFSVWIDDQVAIQSEISKEPHIVEFQRRLSEGPHTLKIRLENKDNSDTVKDETGEIVKDMLLNIKDIRINDVSLGHILWLSDYTLDHPQEYQGKTITKLDNCVNLGWNGTYTLNFNSPFYIWLLEKL